MLFSAWDYAAPLLPCLSVCGVLSCTPVNCPASPLIVTDAPALAESISPSPAMYAMTVAPAMMIAVICVP